MALLMKESNEILSNVYRSTPNLFQHFMPPTNLQPPLIPPTPPTPNETILEPNCTSSSSSSSSSNFMLNSTNQTSQSTSSLSSSNDFSNVFNTAVAAAALSQPLMSPLMLQQQQQQSKVSVLARNVQVLNSSNLASLISIHMMYEILLVVRKQFVKQPPESYSCVSDGLKVYLRSLILT